MAVDVNPAANLATLSTALSNKVESVEAIRANLTDGLHLPNLIDLLIFNPPYVPTEECPKGLHSIEAAWAGGLDGRYWIDKLMPKIDKLLAPKNAAFYMVVVDENKPVELMEMASKIWNLCSTVILDRRAKNEHLSIIKFYR